MRCRLLWVFLALAATTLGLAAPAAAAKPPRPSGDQVDTFSVTYRVDSAGVLHVEEKIVYRFGTRSGRHGIVRDLLVREPFDDHQDQRYDVSDVRASSPSGADASVQLERLTLGGRRTEVQRVRIGSADRTVTGPTATYVISYQVRGALRHFDDRSELYWDATGRNWAGPLQTVDVTVDVPGGVTRVGCFAGVVTTESPCARAEVADGRGRYGHGVLPPGQQLTIVAAIRPGQVAHDVPLIEPAAEPPPLTSWALVRVLGSVLAVILALVAAVAAYFRWNRRGERPKPVTTPPPISVAEACLLVNSTLHPEATQATILELGLLGALRIEEEDAEDDDAPQTLVLVDSDLAKRPHHRALLKGLFPLLKPGSTVQLRRRFKENRRLLDAQKAMVTALREEVATKGWYHELPSARRKPPVLGRTLGRRLTRIAIAVPIIATVLGFAGAITETATQRPLDGVLIAAVVLVAGLAVYVLRRVVSRGRLTSRGRELAVEVRRFRAYLADVPADAVPEQQLIEFLPWAMTLDLGDRWEQMLAGGDPVRFWSTIGLFRVGKFRRTVAAFMAGTLVTGSGPGAAAYADDRANSYGGGGGTSSGFDSGAGAGGGGGGGGGSSW
ncbi:putative membrane protein DUF2207 [Kribbella amoyensis]|uniref:Putative membrane protein DUF2207 n=1 Tax=Kribbella amoyensis TaxID=996641 RepID=A0A561BWM9_9ACTN|nr:DUF2207 domain-containing protein [Kribbella amoyensis]TWD83152.1 putative membrane protein DUF2207 [Kribbella amoyensis]